LYRVVTYYTIRGLVKFVDLGDFAYGEWIIYENRNAKYHINAFDKEAISNIIINEKLSDKKDTIESIIFKINKNQELRLSFGYCLCIEIEKKSELVS
jgi:hypothetical protein